MGDILLISAADLMLAVDFALNKSWQRLCGSSAGAGFAFPLFTGLFKGLIFFVLNGFRFELTAFSALMAVLMSLCGFCYFLIGQQILKEGQVMLYTLFLMLGGMCVPYIFGVLFLEEPLKITGAAGLVAITAALILTNGVGRVSKKQFFLCTAVFFLNGFCSVISKLHQISKANTVSSAGFVVLVSLAAAAFGGLGLAFSKRNFALSEVRKEKGAAILSASSLIGGASYLLQLVAAKSIPASALYPLLSGGSIMLSAVTGRIFFGEKPSRKTVLASAVCLIGTILFIF